VEGDTWKSKFYDEAMMFTTTAVFRNDRIECGNCGALLAKRLSPHGIHDFNGESATEFMRSQEPRFVKKVQSEPNTIEIKCKHRSKGIACDYVNVISL